MRVLTTTIWQSNHLATLMHAPAWHFEISAPRADAYSPAHRHLVQGDLASCPPQLSTALRFHQCHADRTYNVAADRNVRAPAHGGGTGQNQFDWMMRK